MNQLAIDGLNKLKNLYLTFGLSKKAGARDKNGNPVPVRSDKVTDLCPGGAVYWLFMPVGQRMLNEQGLAVVAALGKVNPFSSLREFGDYPSHGIDDVNALIDRAIEAQA